MTREIGSEFHRIPFENGSGLKLPCPGSLVFSGRTAIEAVLEKLPYAHTAMLPSYCCESMIIPFRNAGIKVKFYNVSWQDGLQIDIKGCSDIFLWCNYFGYKNVMPDFDGVVIEDITHSLLSEEPFHKRSDYLVASIRKWEPIHCGGFCSVKADGEMPAGEFIKIKTSAMELKTEYLFDFDKEKKHRFLSMFEEGNHWISENYSGLTIDPWSKDYLEHVDVEGQKRVRRENARALYEGLKGKVQFMFPESAMDCPLFVPIILENRDEVRRVLINNHIYCPVHWPQPKRCESNLYAAELSLICDQRYGIIDMERIVSVILSVI